MMAKGRMEEQGWRLIQKLLEPGPPRAMLLACSAAMPRPCLHGQCITGASAMVACRKVQLADQAAVTVAALTCPLQGKSSPLQC